MLSGLEIFIRYITRKMFIENFHIIHSYVTLLLMELICHLILILTKLLLFHSDQLS